MLTKWHTLGMSRLNTGHRYELAKKLGEGNVWENAKTPSESAVIAYLRVRELENKGGASQATITTDSMLSSRTVARAIKDLKARGDIL
jgi:hypothetical protein